MKTTFKRIGVGLLSGAMAGALVFFVLSDFSLTNKAQTDPPQIRVDTNAIPRGKIFTFSFAPVVKRVIPSVVSVYTTRMVQENAIPFMHDPFLRRFFGFDDDNGPPQPHREQNLGSGVIVSGDGYILTNNHVIEGAQEIKVSMPDGGEYTAKLIGADPLTDVAVLKIPASHLPAAIMTDSSNIQVGDVVLAVGNPFDLGETVTMGIISATRRSGFNIVPGGYEDFIQTDASINPGNSGGPLVDAEGRVIGINTAILSRSGGNQGIGFAVPINMARNIMDQLIRTGKVVRGYLGVLIQSITPGLAKAFGLAQPKGALVGDVTSGSPAAKAGIKPGDVIVELNGQPVSDSRQLRLNIAQTAPGASVQLKVLRKGFTKEPQTLNLAVKLGELPAELAKGPAGEYEPSQEQTALAGVQLGDLDERTRQRLSVPSRIQGAAVLKVDPDSAAASAGLQTGDVILEVNQRRVHNSDEAAEALDQSKGAVLLRVWSRGGTHYVAIEKPSSKKRSKQTNE